MEKYSLYLDTINNNNTKIATEQILDKLNIFIDNSDINKVSPEIIDLFIKIECNNKSETTVSNTISKLKNIFHFYNNDKAVSHLNINYVRNITNIKSQKYLTPSQVFDIIENLLNYQDKVLILLTYLGLYDNDFYTIRNLRKNQFIDNYLLLDDNTKIELSEYSSKIIDKAISEKECNKYIFSDNKSSETYLLNNNTPFIIKTKSRKGSADLIPASTLKKRFSLIGKYCDIDYMSPIMIKNSKMIYDLVKLEYDINYGFDINQISLKNYMKDNNLKGSIEFLNISKKELKFDIINDIINKKDFYL